MPMSLLRPSWYYLRTIARLNIAISALASVFATVMAEGLGLRGSHSRVFSALRAFLVCYASVGTAFGCGAYHIFRREEYPLYYNAGIHVRRLIAYAAIINATVSGVLLLVLYRCVE